MSRGSNDRKGKVNAEFVQGQDLVPQGVADPFGPRSDITNIFSELSNADAPANTQTPSPVVQNNINSESPSEAFGTSTPASLENQTDPFGLEFGIADISNVDTPISTEQVVLQAPDEGQVVSRQSSDVFDLFTSDAFQVPSSSSASQENQDLNSSAQQVAAARSSITPINDASASKSSISGSQTVQTPEDSATNEQTTINPFQISATNTEDPSTSPLHSEGIIHVDVGIKSPAPESAEIRTTESNLSDAEKRNLGTTHGGGLPTIESVAKLFSGSGSKDLQTSDTAEVVYRDQVELTKVTEKKTGVSDWLQSSLQKLVSESIRGVGTESLLGSDKRLNDEEDEEDKEELKDNTDKSTQKKKKKSVKLSNGSAELPNKISLSERAKKVTPTEENEVRASASKKKQKGSHERSVLNVTKSDVEETELLVSDVSNPFHSEDIVYETRPLDRELLDTPIRTNSSNLPEYQQKYLGTKHENRFFVKGARVAKNTINSLLGFGSDKRGSTSEVEARLETAPSGPVENLTRVARNIGTPRNYGKMQFDDEEEELTEETLNKNKRTRIESLVGDEKEGDEESMTSEVYEEPTDFDPEEREEGYDRSEPLLSTNPSGRGQAASASLETGSRYSPLSSSSVHQGTDRQPEVNQNPNKVPFGAYSNQEPRTRSLFSHNGSEEHREMSGDESEISEHDATILPQNPNIIPSGNGARGGSGQATSDLSKISNLPFPSSSVHQGRDRQPKEVSPNPNTVPFGGDDSVRSDGDFANSAPFDSTRGVFRPRDQERRKGSEVTSPYAKIIIEGSQDSFYLPKRCLAEKDQNVLSFTKNAAESENFKYARNNYGFRLKEGARVTHEVEGSLKSRSNTTKEIEQVVAILINNQIKEALIAAAKEAELNSFTEVMVAVDFAKKFGGFSSKNPEDANKKREAFKGIYKSLFDSQASDTQAEKSFNKMKNFSAKFQDKIGGVGFRTARDGGRDVGMRLKKLPDDFLSLEVAQEISDKISSSPPLFPSSAIKPASKGAQLRSFGSRGSYGREGDS